MYICEKSQDFRKCSFQIAEISKKNLNQFHSIEILCFVTKHKYFRNQKKDASEDLSDRNGIKLGIWRL